MLKVMKNELIKAFSEKKKYIFTGILILLCIASSVGMYYLINNFDKLDSSQNVSVSGSVEELARLSGQLFPKEFILFISDFLLPIFLIILAADMICDDYINGTLKFTLITPVNRVKVIMGKLLSIFVLLVFMEIIMMISSYIIGTVFLGWGTYYINGEAVSSFRGFLDTLYAYGITLLPLFAFSSLCGFASLCFSKVSSVIGALIGLIFGMSIVSQFSQTIGKFMIINYVKLYKLLPILSQSDKTLAFVVISAYFVVFSMLSIVIFKRKNIMA